MMEPEFRVDRLKSATMRHRLSAQERQALQTFKEGVRKSLGDKLIQMILFGSRAREEGTEYSDLDVAVLVKEEDPDVRRAVYDQAAEIFMAFEISVSPLVISHQRFDRYLRMGRRIACEIEREGISI